MTPFITVSDIQQFKGISSNINSPKDLIPHILEAQDFDLRPFMGEGLYLSFVADFEASPSLVQYDDLFNGCQYTYQGNEYKQEGLKAVLIYHAYARFLSNTGIISTPTGFVQKTNQYSDPVNDKAIARLIQQARSGATVHEERVKLYLDRYASTYTLWKCSGIQTPYRTGLKIRKIG